ncbi:predicted protein [Streptomyces albidoflavus]|nr:predicted protein [Streptomyces albidoflavus]
MRTVREGRGVRGGRETRDNRARGRAPRPAAPQQVRRWVLGRTGPHHRAVRQAAEHEPGRRFTPRARGPAHGAYAWRT